MPHEVRVKQMVRPTALLGLAIALTVSASVGCASSEGSRRDRARAVRQAEADARHSQVHQASDADDDSSQMTVSGDEGTLNSEDIEGVLHQHMGEILDCYRLARRTPQKVEGRVLLRFFVDAKGEVQDVSIVQSNLGNHVVERCLADIAVGVVFEPPTGHKPMSFDYPVEFRTRAVTADRRRP
jgi:TonB family protein